VKTKPKKCKDKKQFESEMDFEINKLLKQEIVDLKLEVENLKKEKLAVDNQKSFQAKEILIKKQNLEKINIDINKGKN
jgi:predicted metal-dependent peptidase